MDRVTLHLFGVKVLAPCRALRVIASPRRSRTRRAQAPSRSRSRGGPQRRRRWPPSRSAPTSTHRGGGAVWDEADLDVTSPRLRLPRVPGEANGDRRVPPGDSAPDAGAPVPHRLDDWPARLARKPHEQRVAEPHRVRRQRPPLAETRSEEFERARLFQRHHNGLAQRRQRAFWPRPIRPHPLLVAATWGGLTRSRAACPAAYRANWLRAPSQKSSSHFLRSALTPGRVELPYR